ncbi:MAG: low specificity L-threonine aldolase [Fimbriimonas ginsengisoli]|nr:low specificity L-threonine aldolase [Fimbriimonas ginsengisoli]
MYQAMLEAPLGDDVLGDDPTVARLEGLAAQMTGKEAALFVPSGTMGNQVALASHCSPGDAILIEEEAHILYYEVGAPAAISGVVSWTLPSTHGVMDPDVVERHVLKASLHTPATSLLCLENTHNRAGGTIIPLATMTAYQQIAERHGLKIHLDGARLFNASVALGVPARQIAASVDSVSFCLSKGLRSPVGSLLCGSAGFIDKARIWRKRLGGGMRQSGLLAACGLVSLERMVDRLAGDHARARRTAERLAALPGLSVDLDRVQTNIVLVVTHKAASDWAKALREFDIWCSAVAANRLRLMFHADVDDAKTDSAIAAFEELSPRMIA